jgi:hypothetical protein
MTLTQQHPKNCRFRGRMVTNDLHVCLSDHAWCEHLLQFGNGYFCLAREKQSAEKLVCPADTAGEAPHGPPDR